ncbi:flagellar biosynthetic protein FliR [Botrimarina sp.]|uniref:flagellar biosynthetic protein FliR n=1 Tax=Botrimarina sp. TaxID=2795802 RepID=UPI0032F08C47
MIDGLEAELTELGVVFALVFARVGAAVTTAPILSDPAMPLRVRALFAVTLAALVTPTVIAGEPEQPRYIDNLLELGVACGGELLIGLALGLGLMVILSGVQLTGQIVGQMSGMALTEGANPLFGDTASIFGEVYYLVASAVFLAAGGMQVVLGGLMDTFVVAPPGGGAPLAGLMESFACLVSVGFEVGVRASAPLLLALLLATIVLGLVSRTLPQINTIVVGFGLNAMLTLAVMTASIGAAAWAFQAPLAGWVDEVIVSLSPVP